MATTSPKDLQTIFREGDAVEYDSRIPVAEQRGCVSVLKPGAKYVIRGTYIQPLGDIYSDVRVGGKATLVRTERLRRQS